MGGSDPLNLNLKILKVLEKFEDIKVNLITTQANQNLEELKKFSLDKEWINLYINCDFMARLMVESDCVIMTPSVTANEVYYLKIPFIAIKIAENQNYMYEYLLENKYNVMPEFNKETLINIFLESSETETKRITIEFISYAWPAFIFLGLNILITSYLTSMQKPLYSVIIAVLRSLILPVLFIITLPNIYGNVGIFMALAVSEFLTFILASYIFINNRPTLIQKKD